MTKLREPDSIEDAVTQARALLGDIRVCEITGKKISLVKAWSDPDDDARTISFRAGKLLDTELVRKGHEPLFLRLIEHALADLQPAASEEAPLDQAMNCVTAAARTLDNTRTALRDRLIAPHERIALLKEATALQKCLGAFKRSLFIRPRPDEQDGRQGLQRSEGPGARAAARKRN